MELINNQIKKLEKLFGKEIMNLNKNKCDMKGEMEIQKYGKKGNLNSIKKVIRKWYRMKKKKKRKGTLE